MPILLLTCMSMNNLVYSFHFIKKKTSATRQ